MKLGKIRQSSRDPKTFYMQTKDKSKILSALLFPVILIIIIWGVKITEDILQTSFHTFGVFPLKTEGLKGIIFSPLIHGSYQHLYSNTLPLLILGWALFYFYRELGLRITLFAWIMSGLWVWVFARESWHIGASGIIYSWAAFLFVSGVIRGHPRLMALSLLVAFLYGSLVWGIFPLRERVSWEGHLMGLMAGAVLALFYKGTGPQRKQYSWELEEETDDETDSDAPPYWMTSHSTEDAKKPEEQKAKNSSENEDPQPVRIKYVYKPFGEKKPPATEKK